jgi:3-dehydrosphinganine reductase
MFFFSDATASQRAFYSGKHVLVTGGSSGIGRAIALQLAADGASLSLVARGKARLDDAAADVRASAPEMTSARVVAVACDCSDAAAVAVMVDDVERKNGPIDVLINSAGGAQGAYFQDITTDIFEAQMKGNYYCQLYPTQAVFARMKQRGMGGHVVLTSSMAGLTGVFGLSAYSPAKFALRGLAECLYYEFRPHNIDITVAFPPDTDTAGYANEKLTMPRETLAINATAGLFSAEQVANSILRGVMRRQFRVCVGMEGKMLGIATAGLSPGVSFVECVLMPIMRGISGFFVRDFHRIIARIRTEAAALAVPSEAAKSAADKANHQTQQSQRQIQRELASKSPAPQ